MSCIILSQYYSNLHALVVTLFSVIAPWLLIEWLYPNWFHLWEVALGLSAAFSVHRVSEPASAMGSVGYGGAHIKTVHHLP
jgi:hypothetical protein